MKISYVRIKDIDYALIVKTNCVFTGTEQARIEQLEELHRVICFSNKRASYNWAASKIKCAQKPFQDRVSAYGLQQSVDMGASEKRTKNHPWYVNKACF